MFCLCRLSMLGPKALRSTSGQLKVWLWAERECLLRMTPPIVAYNPASITKVRGEAFKQSAVYISPHGKYTAYDATGKSIDEGKNVVHAGWAPGNYYVKQLNDKDWIGVGLFSRFGMISEFERDSKVASNAFFSRLNGASLTPTYARKFDNKWSAAVGRKSIMWVWNCRKILKFHLWGVQLRKQRAKAGL